MAALLLSRYKPGRASSLTLYRRSASTSALSKLAYHTTKKATLEPMSSASAPSSARKDDQEPIDELDVPTFLRTVPTIKLLHHKDMVFPITGQMPTDPKKEADFELIIKKLDACCLLPDFRDPEADRDAKAEKSAVLKDLLTVFGNQSIAPNLPKKVVDSFFHMLIVNLSRDVPLTEKKYLWYDDEPMIWDIAWPHLSLVYQLLLEFFRAKPKDEHFDLELEKLLQDLFGRPDTRERDALLVFFKEYVVQYPERELRIWRKMANQILMYREKVIQPYPVTPILLFWGDRFAAVTEPLLIEESTRILNDVLIPLISGQHIVTHTGPLTELFSIFIERDPSVALRIGNELITRFPKSKPAKQITFINMLNAVTEKMTTDDFGLFAKRLFTFYAGIASVNSSKIVDASFRIWSNVHIIPMIIENSRDIFPVMHQALCTTMKEHWNNSTQNAALNTLNAMHDIDPFICDELNLNTTKRNPVDPQAVIDAQTHKNWALVARQAAKEDRNLNLASILANIQMVFNRQQSRQVQCSGSTRRSNYSSPSLG